MDTSWVASHGGPLLLLPQVLLAQWTGIKPSRDENAKTTDFRWNSEQPEASDYDRACDVPGYTGVLRVADSWSLVIGDEPLPTRWIRREYGGLLVRWNFGPSDAAVERVIEELPEGLPWEEEEVFEVTSSPLVLFDSAEPGQEVLGPHAVIELVPGRYRIDQGMYTPESDLSLHLVRLWYEA